MPPRSRANSIRKKQHTNLDVQSTPSSKSNAVVDKPNSQAITNSIHKHPNSFSPPKPMHKNSGGQHSQASIKNFKAQLDQNFRVLKRHHHNLYGIVDFTNHAVLYKYSEETADWVKEGVEGTLFILMVLDTDEYILKIMNRLTPVDYNENISPSLDIHLVDEYIIYKTPDQGILGLWIYQEKDRIRITECLNRCSSAASNNQPNNKPPCLYTIDDFKGRANTPLASNQTSKLIELYENSIRKAQPNFALAPAVTKTVSDDGAIPQAAQNASNSSQSLMFALQSKLQNAALHQIQSNGPQIPTAESSMDQRKDSITQDRASEFLRFVQDGLGTKPKEDKPSSADIMTNMTQPLANPRSSEISESTDLLSRLRGLSTATNVLLALSTNGKFSINWKQMGSLIDSLQVGS
ncbi:hypothetical protein H4219_004016 [Mycoemilia scoparia]|uniref:Uncharacterized protein n=1 Tax=Mycoemilia scoparia TaxID=417184 RepID=A0A9W7ZT02_9FUNG|nr:hypothetical protein H4219_004016 [Mycoemilia scoparia]